MMPETLLGRVRFLLLQPVDAVRYARTTPADELGDMKAAAVLMLGMNFAMALVLFHSKEAIAALPELGPFLLTGLQGLHRVFDLFAWGMFLYLVMFRRK